jgi:hypothetical protein
LLVQVAAVIDVAAVLWTKEPALALRVLNPTKSEGFAVTRMISQLAEQASGHFARISSLLDDWSETIQKVLREEIPSEEVAATIGSLTRIVDY